MQCEHCKQEFTPVRQWQKYCSDQCRLSHWHTAERPIVKIDEGMGRLMPSPLVLEEDIRKYLLKEKEVTIEQLSDRFDLSIKKIRTALDALKSKGYNIHVTDNLSASIPTDLPNTGSQSRIDVSKFTGRKIRFGLTADNHLCSKYARMDALNALYDIWREDGIELVYQGGNMIDGEARFNKFDLLTRPGIDAQTEFMVNEWPYRPGIVTKFVSGDDHEGWYVQREGIDISAYFNHATHKAGRTDMEFLGYMEHTVYLEAPNGKSAMRLIHAGGGSAYATSYTVQKIVESYQPNEKPSILLVGHFHKAEFSYPRAVLAIQAGCTQDQTPFLRKKRIEAMVGGWTVEFTLDDNGIIHDFKTTWHPFYDRDFYRLWNYHWGVK